MSCGCFPVVDLSLCLRIIGIWIVLFAVVVVGSPVMSDPSFETFPTSSTNPKRESGPQFDDILIREVHAIAGQTLLLPCTVRNLGGKVVSWIRSKDLHILTSGRHTFSGDTRFEPVHTDSAVDFWGLRIRGAFVKDTGRYECQVNTEPKMSLAIWLDVSAPGDYKYTSSETKWIGEALIKGPRTVHVQVGSPVTLECEISPLTSPHSSVFFTGRTTVRWLKDEQELGINIGSNQVSIYTEHSEQDQRVCSTIHLPTVRWEDGGSYTCMQPSFKPDTVKLIVVEGEHSEAMQRDFPISSNSNKFFQRASFCHIFISLLGVMLIL